MRGTIHICLQETIIEKYGEEKWKNCLQNADFGANHKFYSIDNVDETQSIQLFVKSSETLGIPLTQLFDDFGQYWACTYAPREYKIFYLGVKSTKQFIEKIDNIHQVVTNSFKDAHPPRFEYRWINPSLVEITYHSTRGLLGLAAAIVKGLAAFFEERVIINKKSENQVEVKFL